MHPRCVRLISKLALLIKKRELKIESALSLLPWRDSNPRRRNQNPTCYHYTTRQFLVNRSITLARASCYRLTSAKVGTFFELTKFFGIFYSKIFNQARSKPEDRKTKRHIDIKKYRQENRNIGILENKGPTGCRAEQGRDSCMARL